MENKLKREITQSLMRKLETKERLTLSEKGMADVLWGKGENPESEYPRWMKKREDFDGHIEKY